MEGLGSGSELVMASWEMEVNEVMDAEKFRCFCHTRRMSLKCQGTPPWTGQPGYPSCLSSLCFS